ncbi:MAG: protein adenylyltransferase SelO family protein, partial [Pseudoxanthomonas sp.]
CRVSPSFLRFGNFELPASRGELPLLRQLVDFTIRRDFPELQGEGEALHAQWFASVCERTALMVAHWMRVGFVHGVMNTDNMSILGLTIDYGPYGWIDDYDPDWTPNTTDAQGRRYRFGWQPKIAYWNLARLAGALSSLFATPEPLQDGLQRYREAYARADQDNIARKLGLAQCREEDIALMQDLQTLLHAGEMDMTLFFRNLANLDASAPLVSVVAEAFYDSGKRSQSEVSLLHWLQRYAARLQDDPLDMDARKRRMDAANPRYVLRNYLAQQAIDRAGEGDASEVLTLLELLRNPYQEQPGRHEYSQRRPEWARDRAGCSMLSCSS